MAQMWSDLVMKPSEIPIPCWFTQTILQLRSQEADFSILSLNLHTGLLIWGNISSSKPHSLKEAQTNCRSVWTMISYPYPFTNSRIHGYYSAWKRQLVGKTAQWFSYGRKSGAHPLKESVCRTRWFLILEQRIHKQRNKKCHLLRLGLNWGGLSGWGPRLQTVRGLDS